MADSKRVCSKCGSSENKFYAKYGECAECRKSYNRTEKSRKLERVRNIKRYGITENDYLEMLKSQDNKCLGCFLDFRTYTKLPHIDHDHRTKLVRGLLCHQCNMVLGCAYDSPETLINLSKYLINTNKE